MAQTTTLDPETTAMRAAVPFHLLLVPAALLVAACEDSTAPQEPLPAEQKAPAGGLLPVGHWADGYLQAYNPTAKTPYAASRYNSYNASGGAMTITKVRGKTGRYVARFSGLSALLGTRSTVRVTGYGNDATYCKPVAPRLVSDSVEVRCFQVGTGAAANAAFTLMVTRDYTGRAFAYANQPTTASYAPAAASTSNPYGTTAVTRSGVGQYQVYFNGLVGQLSSTVGGHVQVNAVGTDQAHCKPNGWGGEDVIVLVNCYTAAGTPVDAKFTVLFTLPAPNLAYAWNNAPSTPYQNPLAAYRWNPGTGAVGIWRDQQGYYTVQWAGADGAILGDGDVQVTAYGTGNAQCKATSASTTDVVHVRCTGANGVPVDTRFVVMLHS